jgi:hypothetical protein
MRKISQIALMLLIAMTFLGNTKSFAQLEELGNMIAGGTENAKILLQPYITPAVNAFGAALAGGWYNTAEPHKLGGFDITFTGNVAMVPKKYQTFLIDESELTILKLGPSENNETQSIAGGKIPGPQIVYNLPGTPIDNQLAFRMPQGLNTRWVPAPMLQIGVGLLKGTDVMFRFCPNIKIQGNEIGLWGIGGRHDIKQWIPGLKKVPVFKMSILYGFTKLHTFIGMNVNKETIGAGSLAGEETNTWEDQYMKIWVKSQTVNLLLAADLKIVTFYGGLGFVTTKTNLKMEGDFPSVALSGVEPVVVALTDPINMKIKNQDGSVTKPRLNAGIRFKLAIVTLHFDYSWANYSILTAGLGFSFR